MFLKRIHHIIHSSKRHVSISWWKMTEEAWAIDSFPVESVIWKLVEIAPRYLDGHKVLDASVLGDLWQLTAVSKGVRQKEDVRDFTKFLLKELLSIQELSRHRFSWRHVAIKLDPSTTDDLKCAIFNGFFHSLVHFRVVLLQPPVMCSASRWKPEPLLLEDVVDVLELWCPASCNLPLGFCVRPEPGCIDVTVAARKDLMLSGGVLMRCIEVLAFQKCFLELIIWQRHQVCVAHVVDEVEINMCETALLLVFHDLGSISQCKEVEVVLLHLWVD